MSQQNKDIFLLFWKFRELYNNDDGNGNENVK